MPARSYKPTAFVPQANRAVFGVLRKRVVKPKWTPKAGLPSRAEGGHDVPNIALPLAVFSSSDTRRAQIRLKKPCFQVLPCEHAKQRVDGPPYARGHGAYPAPS